ncbi:unnamed protein product [Acanthoscelides obtectus]|uniref:Uncharacterized protein n=1 Tax=Acanthoscelides obtectus TaxID=200917 RepID=A0A9P0Q002_ACAOB|nr:unnamed protein product [Acanthoscelides obtectus]CAK1651115.1 hypothetical protein AOBTE_LOCUS17068 [Acanthoscelides obtectus]
MHAKFLRNQRFSQRHSLSTKKQLKRAAERKAESSIILLRAKYCATHVRKRKLHVAVN